MVRFQWYTDDGSVGQVLPGNFVQDPTADVCYVTAEIKVSGSENSEVVGEEERPVQVQGQRSTVEAQITLPKDFLSETKVTLSGVSERVLSKGRFGVVNRFGFGPG